MCLESKAAGKVKTYQLVLSSNVSGDPYSSSVDVSSYIEKINTYSTTVEMAGRKIIGNYNIGYIDENGVFRSFPKDTELTFDFDLIVSNAYINVTQGTPTSTTKELYVGSEIYGYDLSNNQFVSTSFNAGVLTPSSTDGVMGNSVHHSFTTTLSVDLLLRPQVSAWQTFNLPGGATGKANIGFTLTVNGTVSFAIERTEKEILEDINTDTIEQTEQAKEQTETQKGIFNSIKEFFAGFFQNLIDSVVHLFVPTSDEMSDLLEQLNQFFSDTFGFLYAPFDYFIQLVNVFLSADAGTGLTLPGFSIMGHEVWADQTYDLSSDPLVGQIFGYVRTGTGVLLACWFIMYLQNFFKERFGKG